jgi:hypothetical protein
MPKYFMTWEVDPTKVPVDIKERSAMWVGMLEMVKQQMNEGTTTEWGSFVGETRGYSVGDQSEKDLIKTLQQYYPYVTFEVHRVLTVDEMIEAVKSLAQ